MAINLWEKAGKPTSYNPLPLGQNLALLDLFRDYQVTFKAKSPTNAVLRVHSYNSVNDFLQDITLTTEIKEYKISWTETQNGQLYFIDQNNIGNIVVEDIKVVEKPYPKATINGIDGFYSGLWTMPIPTAASVTIKDNATIELDALTTYSTIRLRKYVTPGEVYSFGIEITNPSGVAIANEAYVDIRMKNESHGLVSNIFGIKRYSTFTILPGVAYIDIELKNETVLGKFIFKKPILNLGSIPAPYEPKRGERMVLPVVAGKNLVTLDDVTITTALHDEKIDVEVGKTYTVSAIVPLNATLQLRVGSTASVYGNISGNGTGLKQTFTFTATDPLLTFRKFSDFVGSKRIYEMQVEPGSTATPFEPYRVQRLKKPPYNANIDKDPKGTGNSFNWGLLFNFKEKRRLVSGEVNAYEAGSVRFVLRTPESTTTVLEKIFDVEVGLNKLEFNWDIPKGNWIIGVKETPHLSLARDDTMKATDFPYTSNDGKVEVLGGVQPTTMINPIPNTFWYFLFNMKFKKSFKSTNGPSLKPARKGLEFNGVIGEYVSCGTTDLTNADLEIEFRCNFNSLPSGTHAIVSSASYSTGILLNQLGATLTVYVGALASCWFSPSFFEVDKETEVKVILDKANSNVIVYKNGQLVTGTLTPANINFAAINPQLVNIGGHPNAFPGVSGALRYVRIKKSGTTIIDYDFANPKSIMGTKVKAKVGPDGIIIGNPRQLNRQATR